MCDTEFEEKTYEFYFNIELGKRTKTPYAPGQVAEAYLGFDAAYFLSHWYVLFRFRHILETPWWKPMRGVGLDKINRIANKMLCRSPKMRLNFFIQYKRPEWKEGEGKEYWSHWGQSYFIYPINARQQSVLSALHIDASGRAAVIYASPAFHTAADLFSFAERGSIIENSNLAAAQKLNGHTKYTYVKKGTEGKGHSEPEDIISPSIDTILNDLESSDGIPAADHVVKTAESITKVVEASDTQEDFKQARSTIIEALRLDVDELNSFPLVKALVTIEAFCQSHAVSIHPV
jgi:hypothetical protein